MACGIRFTTVEVLREDLPDEMIPAAPKRTPKKVMRRARPRTINRLVSPSMPNIPPARKRIADLNMDPSVNADWWD